jgi:hypothetical protein
MIRFGKTRSINLYDKHSTVVLFAIFHCRGVEKLRKQMAKDPVAGNKKCVLHFNKLCLSIDWFEGLRDLNAILKIKILFFSAL